MLLDKHQVIAAIQSALASAVDAAESTAQMAMNETTSGETKSEGQYDTRATEASYLARGQAWRVAELKQLAAWFDTLNPQQDFEPKTVRVGGLIELDGDQKDVVFVAPVGGTRVTVEGLTIRVISPASPMGSAMAELEEGDGFEVDTPRGVVNYEVVSIC